MITISQSTDPGAFSATHYVVTQTPDGSWHWTLTGIALLSVRGSSQTWRHEQVQLILTLPGIGDKWVRLQQWAPFVTLSSIKNDGQAYFAGWAVDSFKLVDPKTPAPALTVLCDVAARDSDGFVLRLGYVIHAVGRLEEPPPLG